MDEIELVKKCKAGDRNAFSRLIKLYEKDFYRVAIAITKDNEDTLDSIQETILQAYKNINCLTHEEYFKTWIIKILINKCNELLRKRKRLVSLHEYNNKEIYYDNTDAVDLKDAVNKLGDTLKIIVILYYFEDMSIRDISESLKVPEGTIKSRLSKAREKLKYFLEVKESEVI